MYRHEGQRGYREDAADSGASIPSSLLLYRLFPLSFASCASFCRHAFFWLEPESVTRCCGATSSLAEKTERQERRIPSRATMDIARLVRAGKLYYGHGDTESTDQGSHRGL